MVTGPTDADAPQRTRHLVVMGVSGCGKTTVTDLLAERLRWRTAEADAFHPQANVDKMTAGLALTDEDRWPWLAAIRDWVTEAQRQGVSTVVSCSALRRAYRDLLRQAEGSVEMVHLAGSRELIERRLSSRRGHFMPRGLLDSQFATLEPLAADEPGITVDVTAPPDALVQETIERLGLVPAPAEED